MKNQHNFEKKNKVGGIRLLNVKPYNIATVVKILWYWKKHRREAQINGPNLRIQNKPIQICPTDFWQRHKSNSVRKDISFPMNGAGTFGDRSIWTTNKKTRGDLIEVSYLIQKFI